jgi:hypothetical protein
MKLVKTTFTLSIIVLLISKIVCPPVYEVPTIVKADQPFNQPYNSRLDNLNDSSADNYKRYKDRQTKGGLYSEMVRNFSLANFKKWLDFFESENLNELSVPEMMDNVSRMTGKAVDLQNFIQLHSGLVVKLLGILDMKLKQIKVLESTVGNINNHGFDINSNLGNNLVWKQNLEELIDYSASVNSNYSLAWSTMCEVLDGKDKVLREVIDSRRSVKPGLEKELYPNTKNFKSIEGVNQADDTRVLPTPTVRNEKDLERGKRTLKAEKAIVAAQKVAFVEKSQSNAENREKEEEMEEEEVKRNNQKNLKKGKSKNNKNKKKHNKSRKL